MSARQQTASKEAATPPPTPQIAARDLVKTYCLGSGLIGALLPDGRGIGGNDVWGHFQNWK